MNNAKQLAAEKRYNESVDQSRYMVDMSTNLNEIVESALSVYHRTIDDNSQVRVAR